MFIIFVTVISNLLVFMTLEIYCIKVFGGIKLSILDIKNLVLNIKTGISLLLGNLASVLIVSIDRWCIQIFLTLKDFSYYSFAVSIENLFNICVSAITIAFYSYLCKEKNVLNIKKMKTSCIIISIYIISISFPVKLIIQIWLNKYENSIVSLFFLIAAHAFYFVIKCRLPRYLTKPRQRRSKWDMAGNDGISRVSAVFRGKPLLTNKMRII